MKRISLTVVAAALVLMGGLAAAAYADKGVPLTRDALRVEMGVGNAAATTYHRHLKECGLIPG